jgi:hypothetical protein
MADRPEGKLTQGCEPSTAPLQESRIIFVCRLMIYVSGRIRLHRLPGEAVAFGENFIDLVNGFPPVAGRTTGPERQGGLEIWGCLPPLLPADKAFGLAWQVLERRLECLEPAVEARCIDPAIGRRRRFNHGPGCWKQGRNPGIMREEMDARDKPGELHGPHGLQTFPRIKELEGG